MIIHTISFLSIAFSFFFFWHTLTLEHRALTMNTTFHPIKSLSMDLLYHGCQKNLLLPTLWKYEVNYSQEQEKST